MRKTKHLITTQGNRTARRCIIHFPFDPAMETALGRDKDPVEYCARPFHFLICLRTGIGLVDFARHSERGKKTKQTEEEVGRHQGMERLEVRQVPEGSGEQGIMEETGCEIICGAPATLAVKG